MAVARFFGDWLTNRLGPVLLARICTRSPWRASRSSSVASTSTSRSPGSPRPGSASRSLFRWRSPPSPAAATGRRRSMSARSSCSRRSARSLVPPLIGNGGRGGRPSRSALPWRCPCPRREPPLDRRARAGQGRPGASRSRTRERNGDGRLRRDRHPAAADHGRVLHARRRDRELAAAHPGHAGAARRRYRRPLARPPRRPGRNADRPFLRRADRRAADAEADDHLRLCRLLFRLLPAGMERGALRACSRGSSSSAWRSRSSTSR